MVWGSTQTESGAGHASIALSDSASLSPYLGLNVPLDDFEDDGDDIFSGLSLTVGF